jgi:hypothetical protein
LLERDVSANFAFECLKGQLCAEHRAEGTSENDSAGGTEFAIVEVLQP